MVTLPSSEEGGGLGSKKQYSQEQKLIVLESAEEVGVKEAAKLAGVHSYNPKE